MHREGEYAWVGLEDERRPVAVVNVQIDDRDALDATRLQHAHRHRDVVELWTSILQSTTVARRTCVMQAAASM